MSVLTILVDNMVRAPGLLGQHGFSVWCESGSRRILFDTGACGKVLASNAASLGTDLSTATDIVLSHGHFDHGGGLSMALDLCPTARVFVPRGALLPRWSGERDIGLPLGLRDRLVRERNRWIEIDGPMQIAPGVHLTGPVPGVRPEWAIRGLVRNREIPVADDVPEEQALVLETTNGLAALSGCAHYGLPNLLAQLARQFPGRPLRALAGGLHLESAPDGELDAIIDALVEQGLECVVPAHCTGWRGAHRLLSRFGEHCEPGRVGKKFEFPSA